MFSSAFNRIDLRVVSLSINMWPYVTQNGGMVSEKWIRKCVEGSSLSPSSWLGANIFLEGMRKKDIPDALFGGPTEIRNRHLRNTNQYMPIIIIGIQPLGQSGQRPEFSQATGMALVRCILGKFLGVVCHCFPPKCTISSIMTLWNQLC